MRLLKFFSTNIYVLMAVVIAVHVSLNILGNTAEHEAVGDVIYVYKYWVDSITPETKWLGLSQPWVYPFIAWVPLLLAKYLYPLDYLQSWLLMVTLLNLFVVGQIVAWGRRPWAFKAAWFYVGFIALLGPVAVTRLDGISVSLAMIGVASLVGSSQHIAATVKASRIALVWFTIGAWLKVWPIALILGVFQEGKVLLRQLGVVAATSAGILGVGLLMGGNTNLISFVTMQTDRGLQLESPISFIWVYLAMNHAANAIVYFDNALATWQVSGDGAAVVAGLMSWALVVALAITALLWWRARNQRAGLYQTIALTMLTATLDLIVFNKVGSPQYQLWLVAPVAFGIIFGVKKWRLPIIATLALALLSQLVYPVFYNNLLRLEPFAVGVLSLRNELLIGLLIWSNVRLSKLGKKAPAEALTV